MAKRRIFWVCAVISAAAVLLMAVLSQSRSGRVEQMRRFALEHQAELAAAVEAVQSGERAETLSVDGVERIGAFLDGAMVEFTCGGSGFGSATGYWGIYWSETDLPLAFEGALEPMRKDEDGWSWQEANQDNHGYTRRIGANWFYFEAYF